MRSLDTGGSERKSEVLRYVHIRELARVSERSYSRSLHNIICLFMSFGEYSDCVWCMQVLDEMTCDDLSSCLSSSLSS